MEHSAIQHTAAAIAYIESHLTERISLDAIACGAHLSKYHLHRMFTSILGITPHCYIQRRQLTEAAKLLAFSPKPILEIALEAGYGSQQAFAGVFKSMYKKTPMEFRKNQWFYPLQLEFSLHKTPSPPDAMDCHIAYAAFQDIPDWMDFVSLIIDGFPCFDAAEHLERLKYAIRQGQALIMRDNGVIAGAMAFSPLSGSIDFFGIHPQYRQYGIAKIFLDFLMCGPLADRKISITTFRKGDKADTGQRAAYKQLGFLESELLTEYGYPAQRLILPPNMLQNTP